MAMLDFLAQLKLSERHADSLLQIGRFVERLWAPEADRLVRGFTDHGPPHLVRVAGYCQAICAINRSLRFTPTERYLLYGGVLLHDIGMQCDVSKRPTIVPVAQKLGAVFRSDLTRKPPAGYDLAQQADIRRNHQYLSAAWIEFARSHSEDAFHSPGKAIDEHLVQDMMDMCLHHTTLPIDKCDEFGAVQFDIRKRLVAAVLRLGDECDIHNDRVNMETPAAFSMDPANAAWWYLHGHTHLTLSQKGLLTLKVTLSDGQYDDLSGAVSTEYVAQFASKNAPLLDELARSGLIVHFDSTRSGVQRSRHATDLPSEVADFLRAEAQRRRADPSGSATAGGSLNRAALCSRLWKTWDTPGDVPDWKRAIQKLALQVVGIGVGQVQIGAGSVTDAIILTLSGKLPNDEPHVKVGSDSDSGLPIVARAGGVIELLGSLQQLLPSFALPYTLAWQRDASHRTWTAGCWVRREGEALLLTAHAETLTQPGGRIAIVQSTRKVLMGPKEVRSIPAEVVAASENTDAALVRTSVGARIRHQKLQGLGRLRGMLNEEELDGLALGSRVRKSGIGTGVTAGIISAVQSIRIEGATGARSVRGVLEITPLFGEYGTGFCDRGDSGAVIVDDELRVVGLLIARGTLLQRGYCVPIPEIAKSLECEVIA